MQESKYSYQGIPISEYCKNNNLNVNTIRGRIWKKLHNKKYAEYSIQEIVDMVIETSGTSIKYMYKGISLRQYCLNNKINIATINSRIKNLRKSNPELNNNELVTLAVEEFENGNYKFFYEGIPLVEYCKKNPEIKYPTIKTFIYTNREKYPSLSDEEIIKMYIDKVHKGIYKYYYLGIPLKQYCEENNLNYRNIITFINRYKNEDEYKNLNEDELIEKIMEKYEPFSPKYMYKGTTLRDYCIKNDISYYSVLTYIKRKIKKGNNKTIDELIEEGINTINKYGVIYYYNGIPLIDYAKENNLNVHSIRVSIFKKKNKSNRPLQEIINECVEAYKKYYIDGITLPTYCKKVGLNYSTVLKRYITKYSDKDIPASDALKEIIKYYIENPPQKTKYYFGDQSLVDFCDKNGYPYKAIYNRIRFLTSQELDGQELIEAAIKKYEKRLHIDKINNVFASLDKITEDKAKELCDFLKISYENVLELLEIDFSYKQAINLIWYFSDKTDENGLRIITDNKLSEVFGLVEDIKSNKSGENFSVYDLIGIYKSELYDSRNKLIEKQTNYIKHTINTLCTAYNIKLNTPLYEEFESELKYYLLLVIKRSNLNKEGQIVKYMDLTVKGYFRKYLKKYKYSHSARSLDSAKYSSDKGTKKEKALINYVSDKTNPYDNIEKKEFSSKMMSILSKLEKEDLNFVILRFQENYSYEELSDYLNMDIEKVKEKEMEILSLLKNNDKVKYLKKEKIN